MKPVSSPPPRTTFSAALLRGLSAWAAPSLTELRRLLLPVEVPVQLKMIIPVRSGLVKLSSRLPKPAESGKAIVFMQDFHRLESHMTKQIDLIKKGARRILLFDIPKYMVAIAFVFQLG